jgi:hypothetical protein
MIKVRIIDTDGKDEVHAVLKCTLVNDKLWFYGEGYQYYLPVTQIEFMQMWEDK